jgi:hypothetical protein
MGVPTNKAGTGQDACEKSRQSEMEGRQLAQGPNSSLRARRQLQSHRRLQASQASHAKAQITLALPHALNQRVRGKRLGY